MSEHEPPRYFPAATTADEYGLVCVGGQLEPHWLLDAYRHGIFPWPILDFESSMAWWSPDPRAILELDGLRVTRRLRRTCRSGKFRLTCDVDFGRVIRGCATAQSRRRGTWITPEIIEVYERMHVLGYAHSVEAWHEGELAGGVYGIALGGLFAAESMFYRVRDASKVALVHLVEHLRARDYRLFDIQQLTEHTETLGAVEIPRSTYLARLAKAVQLPVTFGERLEGGNAMGEGKEGAHKRE